MRVLACTAFALVVMASQSASAASSWIPWPSASSACNRGMLWPYVRNPGDCLTDEEIKAGQHGVYTGPVDSNPDIAAIAPPPPAAAPAGTVAGAPAQTAASGGNPAAPGAANVPATSFSCTKSITWPFVRSPGDCLTTEEKKEGKKGVYGGGTGLTVTQVAATPSQTVAAQGTTPASGAATTPAEPACTKGLLWPFVRHAGDCPTASEQKSK
jgi:hypothetical protein